MFTVLHGASTRVYIQAQGNQQLQKNFSNIISTNKPYLVKHIDNIRNSNNAIHYVYFATLNVLGAGLCFLDWLDIRSRPKPMSTKKVEQLEPTQPIAVKPYTLNRKFFN